MSYLHRMSDGELADVFLGFEAAGKGAMFVYQQLQRVIDAKKRTDLSKLLLDYSQKHPFVFSGTDTDLKYFWGHKDLPFSEIENIGDEKIKKAVKENFNKLIKNGYVEISNGCLLPTEKCSKYIYNTKFANGAVLSDIAVSDAICQSLKAQISNKERQFKGSKNLADLLNGNKTYPVFCCDEQLQKIKTSGFYESEVIENINSPTRVKGLNKLLITRNQLEKLCEAYDFDYQKALSYSEKVDELLKNDKTAFQAIKEAEFFITADNRESLPSDNLIYAQAVETEFCECSDVKLSEQLADEKLKDVKYRASILSKLKEEKVSYYKNNPFQNKSRDIVPKSAKENAEKIFHNASNEVAKEAVKETAKTTAATLGGAATGGTAAAVKVAYEVLSQPVKALDKQITH